MQSGTGKGNKWILEFITKDPTKNPLMGWESSSDTLTELKLEFSTKELAVSYAKKKNIQKNKKIQLHLKKQKIREVSFFLI